MVSGNMMRWACAIAGVVLVVSGCDCPGPNPPVTCSDTTITFETPTAGMTVDSPFEVSINVKTADGTAFPIDGAQLSVSGGSAIDGTVSGNRATFTGVPASAGAQSLVATIASGTCSKSSSAQTITVRDACSNAAVTAVSFPQDTTAPLGVLNRAELPPGTDLQVKVDATCVGDVQVRIKRGAVELSPLTSFTNGTATITLAGIPMTQEDRVDLFAELVRGGAPVNTMASNPQASASIQVSLALPSCAISTTGRFGPSDDADPATAGFQMRVNGTMGMGSTGALSVNGQTPVAVAPNMSGDVSADFTLSNSGAFTATLVCTDAVGNSDTASSMFTVDFMPPTITVLAPMLVDGGATMVITQSPFPVQIATDAEDGSHVEVRINGTLAAPGTVTGGMATIPVPFGIDGTYTLTVLVRDMAGNESQVSFVVIVTLDGCGAIFSRPGSCPALLTPAQLAGGTYSFQTTSKAACANQPAALFRTDVSADGGMSAEVAAGTTTLTAGGLASFSPLTLGSGDYVFRGVVTNIGPDAGVSVANCVVTVDLDGPVITNPVVPNSSTFATISAAQDTQPGTPGAQRLLTFSARVPVGGRVDVCTTQAVNPVTMSARPTSPECGAGWYVLQQGVTSPANGFTFPEGTYDLKVVVVGGGLAAAPASPVLPLLVDSVRPCVNGITRRLPQDANMDGRLNIAELGGAAPRLEFGLGCGDTSATTLAAVNPVVIRDIVAGAVGPVRPSTAVLSGTTYTVTLTGPYVAEADLDVFVQLTDIAGNQNQFAAMNDPASFIVRVDPVAPTCTITSPSAALLGIAQVPSASLDVLIATAADVGNNGVSVTFTGQPVAVLTPNLSQAQTSYPLTGDNTYTIGATCTDRSGNATNATPRTTRVDLVAPTCNITVPSNPAVSSTNALTTTVAVTGVADNDIVTLTSSVAGISNNQLTVASGAATRVVQYPNGSQTITASISDSAGNPCVAPTGGTRQIQLTVNSTSCSLDFAPAGAVSTNANGSWVNRAGAGNPAGTTATVTIGALTSDCGAGRNVYLYAGPPVATPTGTPQVTNAGGSVSFSGTILTDLQQWTVTIDNGAGVLTHRSFIASFASPSITTIGLQRSATVPTVIVVPANAGLIFGAASGNRRVETALATDFVFGDLDGVAADAQFQLTLTGVEGARVGTLNASLEVLEGTSPLMPSVAVTSSAFTPILPRMRLTHSLDETTTTLTIRVTSPAGNVFTSTHVAEVDVIAPGAPSGITQNLSSSRAATVGLTWTAAFDDLTNAASGGLTGGTPAAGYDVRWTTSSVPSNNSMAADADFFGTASNPDGVTSALLRTLTVPPLNSYFIAVRARDEVGNYSVHSAPTALTNFWSVTASASAGTASLGGVSGTAFGQNLALGRLNNDAISDLVVAAPNRATNIGSVFIYYGSASFGAQATCVSPACQEIQPPDGQAGLFGTDVAVGNVGDTASEGRDDLVVGQPTWSSSSTGRAFIFFGSGTSATINAATYVEIRGASGSNFASTARIISSIDGDALSEVVFSAHGFGSGQGRLFIFKGRTVAAWQTLATTSGGTIPMTAADWVIDGATPVAVNGNQFGRQRWGLQSLGDLNGDGRPEFSVPVSKETDGATTPNQLQKVYIFSGAAVAVAVAPIPVSTALNVLTPPLPIGTGTSFDAYSRSVVGGFDILGDTARDLVVAYPQLSRVHIYNSPLTASPAAASFETITGSQLFGFITTAGDVSGDGRIELLVGEAQATFGRAWLLSQRNGATAFDTGLGTSSAFFSSELRVNTAGTRFGRMNLLGDVTGDGLIDVVIGDEGLSNVQVWR